MKKREHLVKAIAPPGSKCVICKGTKYLCGKPSCPLLLKYYKLIKTVSIVNERIYGSSPPGVFVGSRNYPKVFAGPLIPPFLGDTTILDLPEKWINFNIEKIVDFRTKLVRGMKAVDVPSASTADKYVEDLQILAMSKSAVESDALFAHRPTGKIVLSSDVQPFGPSGKIEKFKFYESKVDSRIEKLYYDDLKAEFAVVSLYKEGVEVSKIQRCFSVGVFGEEKRRRFVPTRWAITAVDDIISGYLVSKIKQYEIIDKYEVYVSDRMENIFAVIFIPDAWSYELVESWHSGTLWNPTENTYIISDHELYWGRNTYAQIGGCYYAARLAVAEKLESLKKQASVVVLREAKPSYILPVGVWHVRENVRAALKSKPIKFDNFAEVMKYLRKVFTIPPEKFLESSYLLKFHAKQGRLEKWLNT